MLLLLLLGRTVRAQEQQLSASRPSLPDQGETEAVAVFIGKALDRPGVVWVRVRNCVQEHIAGELHLQRWKKGMLWGGEWRAVEPYRLHGGALMPVGAGLLIPPGEGSETPVPVSGQSVAPGRYRVCPQYRMSRQDQSQAVCSAEVSLP